MLEIRATEVFDKWLDALKDRIAKRKIVLRVRRLALGNLGDFKSVGEGVLEMRIDTGIGYRVYFIKHNLEIILLLVGGDKTTQNRDIEKAKELAKLSKKEE